MGACAAKPKVKDEEGRGDGGGGGGGGYEPKKLDVKLFTMGFADELSNYVTPNGQVLGSGSFGTTWRGTYKPTGLPCAVKEINKKTMADRGDNPIILRREIDFMKSLSGNPNVVDLYGVFEDKKAIYLVMELCTGGELMKRIKTRGPFSEKKAATVVRQMLTVVGQIHYLGVVHRDLKPENFLYATPAENSLIKLIDFGLSGRLAFSSSPISRFFAVDTAVSDEHMVMKESVGTALYTAPEVFEAKYSFNADIWSLGVISYVLITGAYPFRGADEGEIYRNAKARNISFEDSPWPHISEDCKSFIRTLLTVDPAARVSASQALSLPWMKQEDPESGQMVDLATFVTMHRYKHLSHFMRLVLLRMVEELKDSKAFEIYGQLFKDEFDAFDVKKTGYIDQEEFAEAGKNFLGGRFSEQELKDMFKVVDFDQTGRVNFTEFMASALRLGQVITYFDTKEKGGWQAFATEIFRTFDMDGDGIINEEDLKQSLPPNDPTPVSKYIEEADYDGDGKISLADFLHVVHKADWISRSLLDQDHYMKESMKVLQSINTTDPSYASGAAAYASRLSMNARVGNALDSVLSEPQAPFPKQGSTITDTNPTGKGAVDGMKSDAASPSPPAPPPPAPPGADAAAGLQTEESGPNVPEPVISQTGAPMRQAVVA